MRNAFLDWNSFSLTSTSFSKSEITGRHRHQKSAPFSNVVPFDQPSIDQGGRGVSVIHGAGGARSKIESEVVSKWHPGQNLTKHPS